MMEGGWVYSQAESTLHHAMYVATSSCLNPRQLRNTGNANPDTMRGLTRKQANVLKMPHNNLSMQEAKLPNKYRLTGLIKKQMVWQH